METTKQLLEVIDGLPYFVQYSLSAKFHSTFSALKIEKCDTLISKVEIQ